MDFLVTGCAGFIGRAVSENLLKLGHSVIGIDNLNNYYSPELKKLRLSTLQTFEKFTFLNKDISSIDIKEMKNKKIDFLVHLAAQPGVRLKPELYVNYVNSNLLGFIKICSMVKELEIGNFIYASSSSVYGNTSKTPFSESELELSPNSFYGYSKLMNEKIANDFFFTLKQVNYIGLRFFTVYGEFGRPDMLYFKIAQNLLCNSELKLYGNGTVQRDFTYIGDVVKSFQIIVDKMSSGIKWHPNIVNVGGGKPISMNKLIAIFEDITKKRVNALYCSANSQDMLKTEASYKLLNEMTNYVPDTSLNDGIEKFYKWLSEEYKKNKVSQWIF